MRLLNAKTYKLEEFYEPNIPPYAILSHRWEDGEVLFRDILDGTAEQKKGFRKIQLTCDQADEDNLGYAWVDTCCIDKTSSAELSEAINSMFGWYRRSKICYAFLSDVTFGGDGTDEGHAMAYHFLHSAWFTRGWTLQELIAPNRVKFFDSNWHWIFDRDLEPQAISQATRVPQDVLDRKDADVVDTLKRFSVAQRMSWASRRSTTRIEDRAYSLLGIFDIHMPLLYGEGAKAFTRLQEEILRRGVDLSILAWTGEHRSVKEAEALLAISPSDFADCDDVVSTFDPSAARMSLSMNNIGLQINRPLLIGNGLLDLQCRRQKSHARVLALKLHSSRSARVSTALDHEIFGIGRAGRPKHRRVGEVGFLSDKPYKAPDAITITHNTNLHDFGFDSAETLPTHIFVDLDNEGGQIEIPADFAQNWNADESIFSLMPLQSIGIPASVRYKPSDKLVLNMTVRIKSWHPNALWNMKNKAIVIKIYRSANLYGYAWSPGFRCSLPIRWPLAGGVIKRSTCFMRQASFIVRFATSYVRRSDILVAKLKITTNDGLAGLMTSSDQAVLRQHNLELETGYIPEIG